MNTPERSEVAHSRSNFITDLIWCVRVSALKVTKRSVATLNHLRQINSQEVT